MEHALGFTFRKCRELVKLSPRVCLSITMAKNSRKLCVTCSVGKNIAVMQMASHWWSVYWQSHLVISDARRVATQMMWVGQWAAQCTNLLNSIAQQFQDFTYWKEAKHWVVSLHAKTSKFSVSHSPPTLISYNSLCRKYALPIFQLLAYCNSIRWRHTNVGYAQVHSLFIYLVQVGDTSNVKAT